MFLYLIKSSSCLFLLLGFYLLVLEREKMHHFNRFYLLGSILFSLLIPFYTVTVSVPAVAESMNFVQTSEFATINSELLSIPVKNTNTSFNFTPYLITTYLLISLLLSYRFGKNLLQLWRKIVKNQHVTYLMATVVLLKEKVLPHTFWNYIFIDKKEYTTKQLDAQVLTHELAHVEQKHTLDVLFIEILQLIFWFNPIFSWYKKAIQLNHEFLADDAVIGAHKNLTAYQHLLLNLSSQQHTTYLTSNLNYSLTKKRIIMMATHSSRSKILLKKLAIIPLLVGFAFLFAHKVEAQQKDKTQVNKVQNSHQIIKTITPPPIRKTKDQEKVAFYKDNYITIDGQKYYYTFDKNERIARYYKDGKFANLDIKKEYIKKNTQFEKLKNTGVHYVFKPKAEKANIEQLYSDLGGMYFRMSRADKNKVPYPKNPNGVYVQITRKDGSTYYKKRAELTTADKKLLPPSPPPPPRPNATKDKIERFKIANANWKKSLKNIPPPPTPPAPPKPKTLGSN